MKLSEKVQELEEKVLMYEEMIRTIKKKEKQLFENWKIATYSWEHDKTESNEKWERMEGHVWSGAYDIIKIVEKFERGDL